MSEETTQAPKGETPRTNAWLAAKGAGYVSMFELARTLERELAAMTEQRNGANALGMIRIRELEAELAAERECADGVARRVMGDERYGNSPCQAHPLQILEEYIAELAALRQANERAPVEGEAGKVAIANLAIDPITHLGNLLKSLRTNVDVYNGYIEQIDFCVHEVMDENNALRDRLNAPCEEVDSLLAEQRPHVGGYGVRAYKVMAQKARDLHRRLVEAERDRDDARSVADGLRNDLSEAVAAEREQVWLIWSNHHCAWWGADKSGYCAHHDLENAGRYTIAQARSICTTRSIEGFPPETMIHEADAIRARAGEKGNG